MSDDLLRSDSTKVTLADFLGLPEQPWFKDALCAQTDPEAFFPEKGGSTREAKKVCLGCRVRAECLDYALDNDERFGIWGGMSERDRRKVKRALEADQRRQRQEQPSSDDLNESEQESA